MTPEQYVGRVLDRRYHILEFLAAGGMAWLYRAVHVGTERVLAVKILTEDARNKPDVVRRFQREARLTAKLKHENIVDIFDVQTDEDCYLVMEFLVGADLRVYLSQAGRLPWAQVRAIMRQICDALQFAHEHGVVHRDLKPANCFRLEPSGRIKVLDLGIAKPMSPLIDVGGPITKTGGLAGTPPYMAPEHFCGQIDARTDIYSAGVLMFELLTGRRPFRGKNPELLRQIVNLPMPSLASVAEGLDCPPNIDAVVGRALAKLPEERYASIRAFADAIDLLDAEFAHKQSQLDTDRTADVLDEYPEVVATAATDPSKTSEADEPEDPGEQPTIAVSPKASLAGAEPSKEPLKVNVAAITSAHSPPVGAEVAPAKESLAAGIEPVPEVGVEARNIPPIEVSHAAAPVGEVEGPTPRPRESPSDLSAIAVPKLPRRRVVMGFAVATLVCATAFVFLWRPGGAAEGAESSEYGHRPEEPIHRHSTEPVNRAITKFDLIPPPIFSTPSGDAVVYQSRVSDVGELRDWWRLPPRGGESPKLSKLPPPTTSDAGELQAAAKAQRQRNANRAVRNVLVKEGVGALVSQTKVTVRWTASGEVTEATVHHLPPLSAERVRVEAALRKLRVPPGAPEPLSVEKIFTLPLPG